jgi:hypothetical protein
VVIAQDEISMCSPHISQESGERISARKSKHNIVNYS